MGLERIVAVDPGDSHVGVAQGLQSGLRCYCAYETTPDEFAHQLQGWLRAEAIDVVVVEEFKLYPWHSGSQHWSEMETPQLIGIIKWLCQTERAGAKLVMQPASIQKPTKAILRAKKIELKSKGVGPHALSAELHLMHFLLRAAAIA
jgi:hypothetical protein